MLELFRSPASGPFGRRQRHARGGRIPVTIVTGFLGAGKTTLVREFLATPEGRGTAVIVNEFGAVGIDDALLRASADETVLIGNGCLCCTTRSDLQLTLARLLADRDRGALPHFGRVLIETSGLADPGPILQTFASDRALGAQCCIDVAVAVVDAVTGAANLERAAEARKQVILADRLVVTKADLADAAGVQRLTARLRELNARAPMEQAVNGKLDPRCFIESTEAAHAPRSAFIAEAEHGDGIVSFVLAEAKPIAWAPFARSMDTLTALRGPDLLRVKGLLNVERCRGPVVVQFVQHLASPPIELDAWPSEDRTSRLVFITRNMAERDVTNLFVAVRALAADSGER